MHRFILMATLALPLASHAASFDCSKARSPVEITICADAELSRMDDELASIYRRAKAASGNSQAFQADTKVAWQRREKSCRTNECIAGWYRERKAHLLAVIASPAASGSRCLSYQSKQVELIGRLVRKTYPGPPNFEDVEQGDEARAGFYLVLDKPVCTRDDEPNNEPLSDVSEVQLVLDDSGFKTLRPLLSKRVQMVGEIFSWHTAFHHVPLLLNHAALVEVMDR